MCIRDRPIITPNNKNSTNLQLILFIILGIIKKLATISNSSIIGTISLAGIINDNNETLDAEKPNPLNPLTHEARRITNVKKINCDNVKLINCKYSISSQYCHRV